LLYWRYALCLSDRTCRSRSPIDERADSDSATYQLGPLKSRLHRELNTSNAQFSLLIAAYNLNSTWTPLVAGFLVARFGTGWASVGATGCILLGQLILFVGVTTGHLVIMTLGLFIFGLGVTPLAVVQETLVAHLSPSKHLGISLALGLVSGKMASFVSSLVSLPLAEGYGDQAPFGLSVLLCLMSFSANGSRLAFGWGREDGSGDHVGKRRFSWGGVSRLGDVFWLYILL
jgi:MFS family permease